MYAIVRDGGHQYRVSKGDRVLLQVRDAKAGDVLELADVLLLHDGTKAKVGAPKVAGAKVVAKVLEGERKGRKIRSYYYRRTEGYHRTVGHRQKYTLVEIQEIRA